MLNFVSTIYSLFSKTHEKLGAILIKRGLQVCSAESCTGGLLSSRLTDVSGSSAYTRANFVTYSNEAKQQLLGVDEKIIEQYGAVSEECARAMAEGLMAKTDCNLAICTTGIAGPTGGTAEKPVGLIYISVGYKGSITVKKFLLNPRLNRKNMKFMFTEKALELVIKTIN